MTVFVLHGCHIFPVDRVPEADGASKGDRGQQLPVWAEDQLLNGVSLGKLGSSLNPESWLFTATAPPKQTTNK